MPQIKLAILGASGFVGSALCERLYNTKEFDFKAIVRGTGNAARLTRLPIEIDVIDVLDKKQLRASLESCDVVINCVRGDGSVMIKGLKNILDACKQRKIKKFIHLSSMAIYGEDPKADARTEDGIPSPGDNEYGISKQKQDNLVLKMHNEGVPSVIICPSNIWGPFSYFVQGSISNLLNGNVVLVDNGAHPTNLIHVENLVEAILAAVRSDKGLGKRYFINDTEQINWQQYYSDLAGSIGVDSNFESVSKADILKAKERTKSQSGGFSPLGLIRHLVSGEFRNSLGKIELIAKLNRFLYQWFNSLDPKVQAWFRKRLEKPITINVENKKRADITSPCNYVQIREIYHSPQRIMDELGYVPFLNYEQGMATTKAWINYANMGKKDF